MSSFLSQSNDIELVGILNIKSSLNSVPTEKNKSFFKNNLLP